MTFWFEWPWMLLLLLAVPGLAWWFLTRQRQFWQDAFAFSQVSALSALQGNPKHVWLQRIIPLCLLAAVTTGIIGLAQPTWRTKVITHNSYLMLVMDISLSMEATDFKPNRLEVAKKAAIAFVEDLPREVKIGLELFAGNTYLVTPPVNDHHLVSAYLKSLTLQDLRQGTAIGDAIITATDAMTAASQGATPPTNSRPSEVQPGQPQGSLILITDGESNLGMSPAIAVQHAIENRLRIFSIGIGEETGAYIKDSIFTRLDETTLQSLAQQTGGTYFRASKLEDFQQIYERISQKTLGLEDKDVNLTVWCLMLTLVFVGGAFWAGVHYRRF